MSKFTFGLKLIEELFKCTVVLVSVCILLSLLVVVGNFILGI